MNRHVRSKHPDVYKNETTKKQMELINELGSEVDITNIKRYEELNESGEKIIKVVDCNVEGKKFYHYILSLCGIAPTHEAGDSACNSVIARVRKSLQKYVIL